jgi:hypothetical protein
MIALKDPSRRLKRVYAGERLVSGIREEALKGRW